MNIGKFMIFVAISLCVLPVGASVYHKWYGNPMWYWALVVAAVWAVALRKFWNCSKAKPRKCSKAKPKKERKLLDDDDCGIDWREEKVDHEIVERWKGWDVLLDYVPVYEARAAAEKLKEAHIRCRLELIKEDRSFSRHGNAGMGTTMCVLVPPGKYHAAKAVLKKVQNA